jgi:hypothetical protein
MVSAWMVRWQHGVVLCVLLASTTVRAEPEGYQGGEGRAPGTTYNPPGDEDPSLTVRGVTVELGRSDGTWSCGTVPVPRGTEDLVTVTLVISNPATRSISGSLANFDLVIEHDGLGVEEGTCVQGQRDDASADADLRAKRSRIVQKRFLVPRGATPKILVYNDDDFPALFALPKPRRLPAKATRRPAKLRP